MRSLGSMGFAALYPSYELVRARCSTCRRMGRTKRNPSSRHDSTAPETANLATRPVHPALRHPPPRTHSGLTSSASRSGPSATAASPIRAITSATAPRSAACMPRTPCSNFAPRNSENMRLTSVASIGNGRSATSCNTSTQTPPRPTAITGPHCGSRVQPTNSSSPLLRIGATSTPSTRAPAGATAMMRRKASATAASPSRFKHHAADVALVGDVV